MSGDDLAGRRRWLWPSLTVLLAVFTVVGAARVWSDASALVDPSAELSDRRAADTVSIPLDGLEARRLAGGGTEPGRLDLGELDRSLLFLFDPTCHPCNQNYQNWLELLARIRGDGVDAYGIAPLDGATQRAYWRPFLQHVGLLRADTAVFEEIGIGSTPATLVVREGRIHRVVRGTVDSLDMALMLDDLGVARRGGGSSETVVRGMPKSVFARAWRANPEREVIR